MNTKTKYNWLSRNTKMKKSTGIIYNWGITAIKACPNAGACKQGCYANSGAYKFSNVKSVFDKRYELTQSPEFVDVISAEITRRGIKKVRIHDSGDFYNLQYAIKWLNIIEKHPDVIFYAYTKMIKLFNMLIIPSNMIIIYSYGGTEDNLINPDRDRHSKVFETLEQLLSSGYIDATNDDAIAINDVNKKIGLVYHGVKSYKNTTWNTKGV